MGTTEIPEDDQNWFDRRLKKWWDNATVMRRIIALNLASVVLLGTAGGVLIDRLDTQSQALEDNFCAEIDYLRALQEYRKQPGADRPAFVDKATERLIKDLDRYTDCDHDGNPLN